MNYHLLAWLLVISMHSYTQQEAEQNENFLVYDRYSWLILKEPTLVLDSSGRVKSIEYYPNMNHLGKFIRFHQNGNISCYVKNLLRIEVLDSIANCEGCIGNYYLTSGDVTTWYENGMMRSVYSLDSGKFSGIYQKWSESHDFYYENKYLAGRPYSGIFDTFNTDTTCVVEKYTNGIIEERFFVNTAQGVIDSVQIFRGIKIITKYPRNSSKIYNKIKFYIDFYD